MYLRRIETDPDNPQGYAYVANYLQEAAGLGREHRPGDRQLRQGHEFWEKRIALEPTRRGLAFDGRQPLVPVLSVPDPSQCSPIA